MLDNLVEELLSEVNEGKISKDLFLRKVVETLFVENRDALYEMAIEEGFIAVVNEDKEDKEFEKLDATQRIIEKVLQRHGD
jgi:hypothetical protein